MRYFHTSNASRPYSAGGLAFTFQPTGQIGGSWHGILAVESDSAASALANAAFPQVTEITEESYKEYDEAQKKTEGKQPFGPLRGLSFKPRHPVAALVAARGGQSKSATADDAPATAETPKADTPPVIAVTSAQPPEEPLTHTVSLKRARKG